MAGRRALLLDLSVNVFARHRLASLATPEDQAAEGKAIEALRAIDKTHGLTDGWGCNGFEHRFKPARSCPNFGCDDRNAQILFDQVAIYVSDPLPNNGDVVIPMPKESRYGWIEASSGRARGDVQLRPLNVPGIRRD